jgi:hypothetical protein
MSNYSRNVGVLALYFLFAPACRQSKTGTLREAVYKPYDSPL